MFFLILGEKFDLKEKTEEDIFHLFEKKMPRNKMKLKIVVADFFLHTIKIGYIKRHPLYRNTPPIPPDNTQKTYFTF